MLPFSRRFLTSLAAAALVAVGMHAADTAGTAIDWDKARALHQRSQAGETLTDDERAYLERAMAERRRTGAAPMQAVLAQLSPDEQAQVRVLMRKRQNGEPLTDAERALQEKVQSLLRREGTARPTGGNAGSPPQPPRDHTGLVPLTDMTGDQTYKGRDGGLYGNGHNEPPPALLKAALSEAARIQPLTRDGKPDADGAVVLLSVGMSNTTQEFSRFKQRADTDPAKSPHVVLVDGAQGGQAAAQWAASSDSAVWRTVDERLKAAGVTAPQVQVVWLKQAEIRPTQPFPEDARVLAADEAIIVRQLKQRFANLRLVYLSSRIYGGYATTALNPEPYAYESAFAVRDLIAQQGNGDAELNWDPARGAVKAPLLLWGPYLWADGLAPRRTDGLIWKREDLREDGTHPSVESGRDKVATLLLAFFKNDPTARLWFVKR